jgi:hypothetical protein
MTRSQSLDGGNVSNEYVACPRDLLSAGLHVANWFILSRESTTTASIKTPATTDCSDDEGTTIVDKATAANLSTKSSPAVKKEKA